MIYLTLFLEFFKMGALTFGGGYAMIPFIEETVLRHGWMTTTELVDFIATDTHCMAGRETCMTRGMAALEEKYGAAAAKRIAGMPDILF